MKIPSRRYRQALDLFAQMDRAYDAAARASGFVCNGCTDNCCMTRFYHHTLLEVLYLKKGLAALSPEESTKIRAQAEWAVARAAEMDQHGEPVRIMCPLNEAGRCILYAHRPMICRLHGIAHMLRRPDGRIRTGPGCEDFHALCGPSPDGLLDRTPLYTGMARLERQLREDLGFNRKIKMTIAEIIAEDDILGVIPTEACPAPDPGPE